MLLYKLDAAQESCVMNAFKKVAPRAAATAAGHLWV